MEVRFASGKLQKQCRSSSEAEKLFGGDKGLALALLARIQQLKAAVTIRDIVYTPSLHFHALHNKGRSKLEGYFAIDVKSRKEPWRIIIQPLDENGDPFVPCNIDEISDLVRVVKVEKVSKHYE